MPGVHSGYQLDTCNGVTNVYGVTDKCYCSGKECNGAHAYWQTGLAGKFVLGIAVLVSTPIVYR